MLHNLLIFIDSLAGFPVVVFFLTSFFLTSLDTTLSKRKNINNLTLKIGTLIGKNLTYNFFSKLALILSLSVLIIALLRKTINYNFILNECQLDNNTLTIVYFITIITIILLIVVNLRPVSYKLNLNLTLTFLLILIPYLYILNSMISLFFFIEIISLTVFLVLLNSLTPLSGGLRQNYQSLTSNVNFKKLNTNYRYSVFIYYWLSFFFSIFFFLIMTSLSYSFNFTEIDVLAIMVSKNNVIANDLITLAFLSIIIIKLGLPPLHLQKIYIYKGLPITLSLFYSMVVILTYFLLFSNLMYSLVFINYSLKMIIKPILLVSIILILIVLFKELNIKAFFGYSSILNLSLLILALSLN